MLRAIDAGLTLRDFEYLTTGMILDYIITASNDRSSQGNEAREAEQADYDRF